MDENDPLSEYNKIPLGLYWINGAVYSEINFQIELMYIPSVQSNENMFTLEL